MSVQNFKPEVFSTVTLTARDERTVALPLCDRQFEGDFKGGDRVHIPGVGTPTTHDLPDNGLFKDAGGNDIAPEDIVDEGAEFVIDQRKFILYRTNDVDALQMSQSAMMRFQANYGNQMVKEQDGYIYQIAYKESGLKLDKSDTAATSQNMYGFLCDAMAILYNQHSSLTPQDISVEVHPFVFNVISKALDFHGTPNDLKNGQTGLIVNGVKVMQSNNTVATDASGNILTALPAFGSGDFQNVRFHSLIRTKRAIVYAEPKSINFQAGDLNEKGVGEYVKGWYYYGAKVLYPDETLDLTTTLGAEVNV